ncbi:hypothetical protein ACFRAA_33175 [[Kitasatospora] papulosa]
MVPAPRPSKHTGRPRPILPGPRHAGCVMSVRSRLEAVVVDVDP